MDRWFWIVVAGLILIVGIPLALAPAARLDYGLGIAAGIPSSLLVIAGLYYFQRARFSIKPFQDSYNPDQGALWVHLHVTNNSWGLMGGGAATNCGGEIRLRDGTTFFPKWEGRPNPFRVHLSPVTISHPATGTPVIAWTSAQSIDQLMIDQAKNETIRPGDSRKIDIAVRYADEPDTCYIHEPENFNHPRWRPDRTRLTAEITPFDFRLVWDTGHSEWEAFDVVNTRGGGPENLHVRRRSI
jgi:hypothetical protein